MLVVRRLPDVLTDEGPGQAQRRGTGVSVERIDIDIGTLKFVANSISAAGVSAAKFEASSEPLAD